MDSPTMGQAVFLIDTSAAMGHHWPAFQTHYLNQLMKMLDCPLEGGTPGTKLKWEFATILFGDLSPMSNTPITVLPFSNDHAEVLERFKSISFSGGGFYSSALTEAMSECLNLQWIKDPSIHRFCNIFTARDPHEAPCQLPGSTGKTIFELAREVAKDKVLLSVFSARRSSVINRVFTEANVEGVSEITRTGLEDWHLILIRQARSNQVSQKRPPTVKLWTGAIMLCNGGPGVPPRPIAFFNALLHPESAIQAPQGVPPEIMKQWPENLQIVEYKKFSNETLRQAAKTALLVVFQIRQSEPQQSERQVANIKTMCERLCPLGKDQLAGVVRLKNGGVLYVLPKKREVQFLGVCCAQPLELGPSVS